MRACFAELNENGHLKFFKNYRYPLRLGADVFSRGRITQKKIILTEEAFNDLFIKMAKHGITEVNAVATSALRDATNSKDIIDLIRSQTSISIKIINGLREADLIKIAVQSAVNLKGKISLLIDVGGGSTEVTLTFGEKVLFKRSYQFGTVRLLKSVKSNRIEKDIELFSRRVKNQLAKYLKGKKIDICVGTGGNLRRMGKLRTQVLKKPSNLISLPELNTLYSTLTNLSIEQRIKQFDLRTDRADVIVPAMAMIEQILIDNDIDQILLPKVGLKEGVILDSLDSKPQQIHLQTKNT